MVEHNTTKTVICQRDSQESEQHQEIMTLKTLTLVIISHTAGSFVGSNWEAKLMHLEVFCFQMLLLPNAFACKCFCLQMLLLRKFNAFACKCSCSFRMRLLATAFASKLLTGEYCNSKHCHLTSRCGLRLGCHGNRLTVREIAAPFSGYL